MTRFDDSLPRLCSVAVRYVGEDGLSASAVIREAAGRLSLVLSKAIESPRLEALTKELRDQLGRYAREDRLVADLREPGAEQLLSEAMSEPPINVDGWAIHLLDRRIVGADWLRLPSPSGSKVPRIVFSSVKGGVGRSTALCVVAAHLSRRGRRVLAIDFDLEAPGIGTMLLNKRELSEFGTLDYFVESGLSNVDEQFLGNLSADSFLGAFGARVTVVPAIGTRTLISPENALAKIARAYLEVPQESGPAKTLTEQLRELLAAFEGAGAYDAVLIDSRAGLHETAASVILGIGAEVLFFGLDQPQTFQSYRLLMGHLARFSVEPDEDWRERLCFVHAKAPDSQNEREEAAARFNSLYDPLLKETTLVSAPEYLTADDFALEWEDEEQLDAASEFEKPPILYVLEDDRYRSFDPISNRKILDAPLYTASFNSVLEYVDSILGLEEAADSSSPDFKFTLESE
jgi:Mrp family chromosome partitioning ATPase